MDAEGRYENRPETGQDSCWAVMFHPLSGPVSSSGTMSGSVKICGKHDRIGLRIWKEII
jgi:hypothetical protein